MGIVDDPKIVDIFNDTALYAAGVAALVAASVIGWVAYKYGRWTR